LCKITHSVVIHLLFGILQFITALLTHKGEIVRLRCRVCFMR